jgi:hypothetical protein
MLEDEATLIPSSVSISYALPSTSVEQAVVSFTVIYLSSSGAVDIQALAFSAAI